MALPVVELVEAFLAALPDPDRKRARAESELGEVLAQRVEEAAAAWPGIPFEARAFAVHVAGLVESGRGAGEQLGTLRVAELFLAWRCACGDRWAIDRLEREFQPIIDAAITRNRQALSPDDAHQLIREKLLVGSPTQPPALRLYGGRAPLAAWLRLTARRVLIDRARRDHTPPPELFPPELAAGDEELQQLRRLYNVQFSEAFTAAIAGLDDRDRALLRHAFVHGLSARQLGELYRVHHATAARWVAKARDQLVATTRAELRRVLDISERELDSVVRMIDSGLHVSIARILGER